jgi:hypothetical protein
LILGVGLGLMAFLVLSVGAVLLMQHVRGSGGATPQAVGTGDRPANASPEVDKQPSIPADDAAFARWQDFSSDLGRFSIRMPRKPLYKSEPNEGGTGPPSLPRYVVENADGSKYEIGYKDLSDAQVQNPNPLALLDAAFQESAKQNNAYEIESPRSIRVGSHPGREASAKLGVQGKAGSARMLYCIVGNRGYVLIVQGVGDFAHSKAADYFFDSFRVEP